MAIGVGFLALWLVALVTIRARGARRLGRAAAARRALADFSIQSLELQSAADVLDLAAQAGRVIFGTSRPVGFLPGDGSSWLAHVPDRDESLGDVPAALTGVFGWFRHNPAIAVRADLAEARYGAMRAPLRQVMEQYGVDVLMPLVHRGQSLGVFGIALAQVPGPVERVLLSQFRLEVTQASANVRLHREASHVISLAKEVDLASAVQQTLVPEMGDGSANGLEWAGHFRAAGDAGSDFWTMYPLPGDRTLVLIADATGIGLAGSMLSAVVKSCCDALMDSPDGPATDDPAKLLRAANVALYRSEEPVHMRAFAAVFDPTAGTLRFANAGHRAPYHLRSDGLGVLSGPGPMLGDDSRARYKTVERRLTRGDAIVFYTDGIVGTRNPEAEVFGERKLQRLLDGGPFASAMALRDGVLTAVERFRGGGPLLDDEAMVVVRLT